MEVAQKIGSGKPAGAVFKSRQWTGEVIKPDAPGRDPIVSRILWLRGTEKKNSNTYSRCIYIHGTTAEKDIGKPVSYGCVQMKSEDVIDLYRKVGEGATVYITKKDLSDEATEPQIGNSDSDNLEIEALPLESSPRELPAAPAVKAASVPASPPYVPYRIKCLCSSCRSSHADGRIEQPVYPLSARCSSPRRLSPAGMQGSGCGSHSN